MLHCASEGFHGDLSELLTRTLQEWNTTFYYLNGKIIALLFFIFTVQTEYA